MLSDRDRAVLAFEASWWQYPGPKDRAIREYLDMSATRYYQVLRRLRRVREHAKAKRLARSLPDGTPVD